MLEFFKLAQQTRNPELADKSLVDLMREAAEEAGWHTEYISNLQSRTKDAVRYNNPFRSDVVAELACRMKPAIMRFINSKDIDPQTIDSHIGWGFHNFIKTYKPAAFETDWDIQKAVYQSIKNKVNQSNRKETYKYRPTRLSILSQVGASDEDLANEILSQSDSGGMTIIEAQEKTITYKKYRYINTPREISFNTPVYGKDGGESGELGDFLADDRFSPYGTYIETEDEDEVIEEYSSTVIQKVALEILLEAGAHGRLPLKVLQREMLRSKEAKKEVISELKEALAKKRERAVRLGKEINEDDFTLKKEDVIKKMEKKVKVFYRQLKAKLEPKLCH